MISNQIQIYTQQEKHFAVSQVQTQHRNSLQFNQIQLICRLKSTGLIMKISSDIKMHKDTGTTQSHKNKTTRGKQIEATL
jgi:predicted amidophosphoribosyltransferase